MTISELITGLADRRPGFTGGRIEAAFSEAVFGLKMEGLPDLPPGTHYTLAASDDVTMQFVTAPDGKKMIKACADPPIFEQNYPGCITATMTGKELAEMALKVPEAHGVLLCSATSFNSYPIYNKALQVLITTTYKRRWWQFWKRA